MICWEPKKCTRQNTSLPSARKKALGKDAFCRVPKNGTRQNTSLPSSEKTLGKAIFVECIFCRVYFIGHSAKTVFAECQKNTLGKQKHTAKYVFAECFFLALGKEVFSRVYFFLPWANQFFEAIFEALNEFKWKTFQLQSCITSQDLQSLFWSFLHLTKRQ